MTASLAYRKNEAAILRGDVPEKYTRLLPHIPGERILEIGSAEGVLALMLAIDGKDVVAVERNRDRVESANDLGREWNKIFHIQGTVEFIQADIAEELGLLDGKDTLVAVRMIYYLHDALDPVFSEVAKKVPNVVLCGNRNRADRWRAGVPDELGGADNFYATRQGMADLLRRHGYTIVKQITDGDEIVVGRMD